MPPNDGTIVLEGVRITYRNFAGREGQYNQEGDRNFAVLLDDDKIIAQLEEDGWNVKYLQPRDDDEGGERQAFMQVSVKYRDRGGRPVRGPRIVMVTSRGRTPLGEREIEVLDWADIRDVDMIIRPFTWSVGGKGGIKAYLQSMFITIEEDALERKYGDLDLLPARGGRVDEG